jgi:TRAP-type C4-dicarboxylate transport system substrate-binding protein
VRELAGQVKALSNGSMVIEPVWDAGSSTADGFERGVIQAVRKGTYPLGLAASRTWDTQGLANFQALQVPFLITNDALAEAVAAGDIGTRMLASLPVTDVVGLAMWPEDLRHPFAVMPDKPLLAPEDFKGLTIRSGPSNVTDMMLKTLGATPLFQDSGYQGAESGLRQGPTLMGKPAATANVTFYSKYQIMFANGAAFAQLNDEQRTILRQAAAAAQKKAIAEHPRDVEAGKAWCDDDGTIVLASDSQVAAFEQAEQPVFDKIAENPTNADFIAAIRDLKAHTTPSPLAAACAPVVSAPTVTATTPVSLTTTDATLARLRLANWVSGSGPTDMYVDGQIALLGSNQHPLAHVPVGFMAGFLYLEPGRHSVAIVPSGKGLDEAMIAQDVDLEAGHRYTVGVMGQKEDGHFSPHVIDETTILAKAGNPDVQNMMIYVNNTAGDDNVNFLEDGVGPSHVPLGGIVAAPLKSGHVDHLVVTVDGKQVAEMRNIYELPSGGFIHAQASNSGPYDSDNWSELNARDALKQFDDVHVVMNDGYELKFDTFLAAVEKSGLSDLLTSGTYLIFAPTDAAFAAMPKVRLDVLMADPKALADFVRYHIVQGYYPPGSLSGNIFGVAGSTVTNLQGADLKLSGDLTINGINLPGLPSLHLADGTRIIPVTKVLAPTGK